MPKNQKRLGRGLNALISVVDEPPVPVGAEPPSPSGTLPTLLLDPAHIRPNPFQARKEMPADGLEALAESIRKAGLIQPITVRRRADQLYELVVGERRWRACQMAGVSQIPAHVRDASDEEMLEIALVENIFREDLNAIDRATAYRHYCDAFSLSPEEVAARLGEDRSTVANYLRLLDLPAQVKDWVAAGNLAMGHARCLLAIKSPSQLVQAASEAIELGLSVRALEKRVQDQVRGGPGASRPSADRPPGKRPQIRSLEEMLMRELGTKVEIQESRRKGSGKVVIHYHNLDDFDRIAERLGINL